MKRLLFFKILLFSLAFMSCNSSSTPDQSLLGTWAFCSGDLYSEITVMEDSTFVIINRLSDFRINSRIDGSNLIWVKDEEIVRNLQFDFQDSIVIATDVITEDLEPIVLRKVVDLNPQDHTIDSYNAIFLKRVEESSCQR